MNLTKAYQEAKSYEEYMDGLGEYLSLHLLHYKKFSVEPKDLAKIKNLSPANILVITEPWCSDSLAILPIVRKIAEIHGQWNIKVVYRDENEDLMAHFRTNGLRAIPIFIFLDEQGEMIFKWGPRPQVTKKIFEDHQAQIAAGQIEKKKVQIKIRAFYAKDKGESTFQELMQVFYKYLNVPTPALLPD